MKKLVIAVIVLATADAIANPDKARTEYNRCLAELASEQRKIDVVERAASQRCKNAGVCIEVTIDGGNPTFGTDVAPALSRMDAYLKGDECMGALDVYEDACEGAGRDCDFKTFDEVYDVESWEQ